MGYNNKDNLPVKKELIITTCVCLLPILSTILFYNRLPDQIPVQWGNNGVPSSYKSKLFVCFGMPFFFAVLNVITNLAINGDPKKKNASKTLKRIVKCIIPITSVMTVTFSLTWSLGYEIPIVKVVYIFIGIIFVLFGNYLPKSRLNYTIGVKLPWTLDNEDNWNKTNRLAGYLMMIMGIVMLIIAFIPVKIKPEYIFIMTILYVLTVFVYSYFLYVKKSRE